jgi:hypothetical protein
MASLGKMLGGQYRNNGCGYSDGIHHQFNRLPLIRPYGEKLGITGMSLRELRLIAIGEAGK